MRVSAVLQCQMAVLRRIEQLEPDEMAECAYALADPEVQREGLAILVDGPCCACMVQCLAYILWGPTWM